MNDVLCGMEKKEVTAVIILDMSVAFNTVDHDLLLTILKHRYGITDTALQWYQSYLRPEDPSTMCKTYFWKIQVQQHNWGTGTTSLASN